MPNMSPTDMAKQWPALSQFLGMKTAGQAGLNPNDPQAVVTAMHSRGFQQKVDAIAGHAQGADPNGLGVTDESGNPTAAPDAGAHAKTFGDDRFLARYMGNQPTLPDPKASPADQEMQAYDSQTQSKLNQIRAGGVVTQKILDAQNKLDQIGSLDTEAYMREELKKRNVGYDIDARILNLRMMAITSDAILRGQLAGLDPSARNQRLAENRSQYDSTIQQLQDIRSSRVETEKGQIQGEIDAHQQAYNAAKAHVDSLSKLEAMIKSTGENTDALAKIQLDKAQAMAKLKKASGSGLPLPIENIKNAIIQDYVSKGGTVNASTEKTAELLAKESYQRLQATKGQKTPATLQGVRSSSNLMDPPGANDTPETNQMKMAGIPLPQIKGDAMVLGDVIDKAKTNPNGLTAKELDFLSKAKTIQTK